jgi:prephenate dehydrogenase
VTHMADPLHEMKGPASNHGHREVLVNTPGRHRKVVDIGTNPITCRRHDRLMAEVRLLAVHIAVAGD